MECFGRTVVNLQKVDSHSLLYLLLYNTEALFFSQCPPNYASGIICSALISYALGFNPYGGSVFSTQESFYGSRECAEFLQQIMMLCQ